MENDLFMDDLPLKSAGFPVFHSKKLLVSVSLPELNQAEVQGTDALRYDRLSSATVASREASIAA